jgi:nicotinate-nucleotide adenylyltransferase
MKSRVVLYFGSFNPVHRGHIALAEYVISDGFADQVVMIVSPQNPHKEQSDLAAEFSRYEMCQAACAASLYPDKIQVSAVEFTLPRPSYTIDTLNFLAENFGDQMEFSILMGADNIENFHRWKNSEQIIANYPILVYPRREYSLSRSQYADRVVFLENAPLFDFSATDVRTAIAEGGDISEMVISEVESYIKQNKIYR